MNKKLRVGVLGATGFVGQRLITLLNNHPFFEVTVLGASPRSAGKTYKNILESTWKLDTPMPEYAKDMIIKDINSINEIKGLVDFVFCAVNMPKEDIKKIEEAYAKAEVPVVSNNSAHRMTKDVPVIIPEINNNHLKAIEAQKKRLNTTKGFIVAKPNCSIQSYVPALTPLMQFKPTKVLVSTYQAISGSGKTPKEWPEMNDNVIPFIGGEEEKSEQEPLKVWGNVDETGITLAEYPVISAQCIRVPVSDGHLATVAVSFENKPTKEEIISLWKNYKGRPQELELPLAPKQFLTYFEDETRPQTRIDREIEKGMGITIGRLREDNIFDYKFVCLSHNTLRGAAGGALLTAELLYAEGLLK
ncbi:aspartate-semialdehyde dehydrogenase [Clostridium cavendishii DSM 21758]|uniref:Aspartate-semialdehyde dehydrogenase n=1 Tax=Clostridium cavendishii DSM 21758 TaxID=1121302 RepID=A0A1M6BD88_9CLOT|nr:aspartate-semialdehyde dehydrogenase [Clostridium cavendishii]SHI46647.1 aspartate-semialdehyde dehydrogenase [Clostridium cavendishii DSM 21758]